jgi:hypothetical protein
VRAAFAALVCAIALGSLAADLLFLDYFGPTIVLGLPMLPFAIVGSFLVLRRAGDPIGWLLGVAGALFELGWLLAAYAYTSLADGAASPGGEVAAWLLSSFYATALFGLVLSAVVRFPDGRPPGRAFAILLWASVACVVIALVAGALGERPIAVPAPLVGPHAGDPPHVIPNPFALHGPLGDLVRLVGSAMIRIFPGLALIAASALVVRFRRSRGVEREQLKWITYTAAISVGLLLIGFLSPAGPAANVAQAASLVGIGLLPVAIGIAVTRYRLYDIDLLIRRTLIYAVLSVVLLATYIGGVALLQTILAPLTSGSGVAVAISTLAVVALFQPIRRRIQAAVDRRFYRAKYDADLTLDAFTARLRDEVDLVALEGELLAVVNDTVQPTYASVWLR